jgi:hypothetical protein
VAVRREYFIYKMLPIFRRELNMGFHDLRTVKSDIHIMQAYLQPAASLADPPKFQSFSTAKATTDPSMPYQDLPVLLASLNAPAEIFDVLRER